jgi:flagellar protein FlaG
VQAEMQPLAQQPQAAVRVNQAADAFLNSDSAKQQGNTGKQNPFSSDALETLNDSLKAWSTGLRFEMDEEAQRLVVSIVDNETGEVIRQVPSEAVLKVAKMITQLQGGGVNTKA